MFPFPFVVQIFQGFCLYLLLGGGTVVGHRCHGSSVQGGGLVYGISSPFYFHVGSKIPNMGHQASTASAFILPAPNFSNLIKFK